MLIIDWQEFLKNGLPINDKPFSVTVGVFDGVHRGHKALIEQVISHNATPVVFTFREPAHKNEREVNTIQTFKEKALALESLGVQILIVVDFTESFSRMSGKEFLETLLAHMNIGFFAVGANFRCGWGLDTNASAIRDFFTKRSIPTEIVPEVLHDGLPISSSRIREALAEGDLDLAQEMLG